VRVLVTGGAGFIGSHVVDALVDGGHEALVVDLAEPAYANPSAEYTRGDVGDAAYVLRLLPGVDAVCHQAARVGLGVDFADVSDYVRHNDAGTAALLWALHDAQFLGRLVLASSMVVYGEGVARCATHGPLVPPPRAAGDLDAGRFDPRCPQCGADLTVERVTEDAPTDPRNVYAATKLHQEHLCAAFGREHGNDVVALRYHNVYGPRMPADTPYSGVAAIFLSALRAGRAPDVFEDGLQQRDFVHVHDVARANVLALEAPDPIAAACNIASGTPRTVSDLARALAASVDGSLPPNITGRWRAGDVRHIVASPARAASVLNFVAEMPFEKGVAALANEI